MGAHSDLNRMLVIVFRSYWIKSLPIHIPGEQNPADCASRGLFPGELLNHELWWNGPEWLTSSPSRWPQMTLVKELVKTCNLARVETDSPPLPLNRFSSHLKLVRVTAWVMRFIKNCPKNCRSSRTKAPNLSETSLLKTTGCHIRKHLVSARRLKIWK